MTGHDPQQLRSRQWVFFFDRIMKRQLRRSFHAVRLARPGMPAVDPELPLIIYSNHPSWWDAAMVPPLVSQLQPARRFFAPIDALALKRYPFLERVGLYGIEQTSYAGTARFLRLGSELLKQRDCMLCITPEGRFTDVRQRPVRFRPGLGALIRRVPRVTVLPLAVEYGFWTERTPEALARFGEPVVMGADSASLSGARGDAGGSTDTESMLEARLTTVMDALALDAASADPQRFTTVFDGRAGVGGVYDIWRRFTAWRRGERFDPAHQPTAGEVTQ